MCGILGLFNPTAPISPRLKRQAHAALQMLAHRGPDGSGTGEFLDGRCWLGHRRLSIIDLSTGTQPLGNEDGTVWITFNGEIYNYLELREELLRRGHTFKTQSDTEVLVHLYEASGESFLDLVEGMFAFGLVDVSRRRLLLARDRMGEKPLYYARLSDGTWAFASELKALRPLPGFENSTDVAAITQFLALGYIPAERTHLLSARKLRAAEAMLLGSDGEPRRWRYWQVRFEPQSIGREEAVEQARALLRTSITRRLRSDVPVGCFLSGGIDSTLVVATVRELCPNIHLKTYCATFEDADLDEAGFARTVAARLGTDHTEVRFHAEDMLPEFEPLVRHYDEPFGDYSLLPTFAVCRSARERVKVILAGDGADECFGGYTEHFQYRSWNGTRQILPSAARRMLARWPQRWRARGLARFLASSDGDLLSRFAASELALSIVRPEFRQPAIEGLSEINRALERHMRLPYPTSLMQAQLSDFYLPEQILVKVDRASMRVGLESRAPFLDHHLVEFAAQLPANLHFRCCLGKVLLRRALPSWVPDSIRWRPKRGFTPPLALWFRTSLKDEMRDALARVPKGLREIVLQQPVAAAFDDHQSGADNTVLLFRWFSLITQFRQSEGEAVTLSRRLAVRGT